MNDSARKTLPLLLLISLLLAACNPAIPRLTDLPVSANQPASPAESDSSESENSESESSESEEETSEADAEQGMAPDLAGRWEGAISVSGVELTIILNFEIAGDGFTGTIDIPQQGASGLPVNNISVDGAEEGADVYFEILAGPQLGVFEGTIDGSEMSGSFTQAGTEATFAVSRPEAESEPVATEEPAEEPAEEPGEGAEAPAADGSLPGLWEGALSIAGLSLDIVLDFAQSDGGFTGTIDIPQQGAVDLPINNISVNGAEEGADVYFEILSGPQMGVFEGTIDGDSMSGSFTQAGMEGTFEVTLSDEASGAAPSDDEVYADPDGLYTVPIPTNWTVAETDDYALFSSPDDLIQIYTLVLPGEEIREAVDAAWALVDPDFDLAVDDEIEEPTQDAEQAITYIYDTPEGLSQLVLAGGQRLDGLVYIQLVQGDMNEFQRRLAQVQIIATGFEISGVERDDLTGVAALPVDESMLAELETYITERMEQFSVPGAVVAIVQDGELVYAEGFGTKGPESDEPITPQTHMMIGSTGKTMTTLLMAALVDEGLLAWDEPVINILPSFAVADPELTETLTVQNLVCACTGVPRRDFELVFNANDQSAEDVVAELATYEFFTDFGEAFQYSNQMVATGGYVAGAAANPAVDSLYDAYAQALADYVTEPIGMENTTVSFEDVLARGDYATPYGINLSAEYYPMTLDDERLLLPVGPAGVHWSTAEDMARYVLTELGNGTTPDGVEVVSADGLAYTWEPQIGMAADTSYGLGWIVNSWKGLRVLSHGGNTFGFTSDLAFVPAADTGIVVLTNGRGTNLFNEGVRFRLLELLYDQPFETEDQIQFAWEQTQEQYDELAEDLGEGVVIEEVEPFLGGWTNPALGDIELRLDGETLLLDAGDFVSQLLPLYGEDAEEGQHVLYDMPLAGVGVRLEAATDEHDDRIILGGGVTEYAFERE